MSPVKGSKKTKKTIISTKKKISKVLIFFLFFLVIPLLRGVAAEQPGCVVLCTKPEAQCVKR
jgi:hypothetical protein